jgi:hypothetical protein
MSLTFETDMATGATRVLLTVYAEGLLCFQRTVYPEFILS